MVLGIMIEAGAAHDTASSEPVPACHGVRVWLRNWGANPARLRGPAGSNPAHGVLVS